MPSDNVSREDAKAAIHKLHTDPRPYLGGMFIREEEVIAALDALPAAEDGRQSDDFWTNLADETVELFRKALAAPKSEKPEGDKPPENAWKAVFGEANDMIKAWAESSKIPDDPERDRQLKEKVHAALAACGCDESNVNALGALAFAKVLIEDFKQNAHASKSRPEYYKGVVSGLDRATFVCDNLSKHIQRKPPKSSSK